MVEGASVLMHSPSVSVADSSLPEGALGSAVSEIRLLNYLTIITRSVVISRVHSTLYRSAKQTLNLTAIAIAAT